MISLGSIFNIEEVASNGGFEIFVGGLPISKENFPEIR